MAHLSESIGYVSQRPGLASQLPPDAWTASQTRALSWPCLQCAAAGSFGRGLGAGSDAVCCCLCVESDPACTTTVSEVSLRALGASIRASCQCSEETSGSTECSTLLWGWRPLTEPVHAIGTGWCGPWSVGEEMVEDLLVGRAAPPVRPVQDGKMTTWLRDNSDLNGRWIRAGTGSRSPGSSHGTRLSCSWKLSC